METIDLGITGFRITEQNQDEHILFLFTSGKRQAEHLDEQLGDYVQLFYHENEPMVDATLDVNLLDTNQTDSLRIDKKFCKPEYLLWLRSSMVTHLGVYYFHDGKDIPLLRVRPLSW